VTLGLNILGLGLAISDLDYMTTYISIVAKTIILLNTFGVTVIPQSFFIIILILGAPGHYIIIVSGASKHCFFCFYVNPVLHVPALALRGFYKLFKVYVYNTSSVPKKRIWALKPPNAKM